MTEPTNPKPRYIDLVDQIDPSKEELAYLHEMFEKALSALENLDDINAALRHSERPDLVIETPVEIMPLDDLRETNTAKLNNFIPHLLGTVELSNARTTQDWQEFFDTWGAKGEYSDYEEIGKNRGNPKEVYNMMMQTSVAKPALMRMWILFPELSRMVFDGVRNRDTSPLHAGGRNSDVSSVQQEVFVAYNIMARLIDESDPEVLREDKETGIVSANALYLWT